MCLLENNCNQELRFVLLHIPVKKEQCVLPGARKSSICAPGPEHAKKKKDVAQYANTPADVFAHSIVA
jgi:hypothetical protein